MKPETLQSKADKLGITIQSVWVKTEKGRAYRRAYQKTPKYRARQKAYKMVRYHKLHSNARYNKKKI